MQIDRLKAQHKPRLLALLDGAKLPFEDLIGHELDTFLAATAEDGSLLGAIGLESYGDAGLLRSLVVDSGQRGRGLGVALTRELERRAQEQGIRTLYLLTTTAAEFFPKLGYEPCDRASVPASIAATEEFRSLCPDTAVCLLKRLAS